MGQTDILDSKLPCQHECMSQTGSFMSCCIFNTRRTPPKSCGLHLPQYPSTISLHFFTSSPMSFYYNLPTLLYLSPNVLLLQSPYTSLPLPPPPPPPMSFYYNLPTLLYLSPNVLLLQSPYTSLPLPHVLLLQSPYTSLPLPQCPSTTISLHFFPSPPMSFYYNLPTLLYLSPYVLLLQSPYTSLPLPQCPSTTISLHFFTSPPMSFYYNLPTLLYLSPNVLLLQSPYTSLPNCLCPFFQHVQTTVYHFVCSFLCLPTPGNLSTSQKTYLSVSITHPPYHHHVISLHLCQFLFFPCAGLPQSTKLLGNFTFCAQ